MQSIWRVRDLDALHEENLEYFFAKLLIKVKSVHINEMFVG